MSPMSANVGRRMKRWQEQRWILDNIIKTVGIEWDQNRIGYTLGPCGPEAAFDFMGVRNRVQKFDDIAREFGRAAARREALACRFEEEGRPLRPGKASLLPLFFTEAPSGLSSRIHRRTSRSTAKKPIVI